MELALGVLRWSEEQFWASTHFGLTCAYVGYCRREGLGRWERDPAGFNFENAEQITRHLKKHKKKNGESSKMEGVAKDDRAAYKANRRALRERGQLWRTPQLTN